MAKKIVRQETCMICMETPCKCPPDKKPGKKKDETSTSKRK